MKKLIIAVAALAMFTAASGSVLAKAKGDKATAYCTKLAKKHHITADKMESYMKTCVEKHQKKGKKAAAKKPAAPATPASPAPATGK